jgi:hypothetical protein
MEIHYHPGKANVVADALSRKAHCNYLSAVSISREESSVQITPIMAQYNVTLTSVLRGEIIVAQSSDEGVAHIKRRLTEGDPKVNYFSCGWGRHSLVQGWFSGSKESWAAQEDIWWSSHFQVFHPPGQHKDVLWFEGTIQVDPYEAWDCSLCWECDMCRRIKTDHMRPAGLLQPLSIHAWKWEDINMDFIVGLPLTGRKFNSIWVIVDRLTKSAHFIFGAHLLQGWEICWVVCFSHPMPAWCAEDYHFWPRAQFITRFWGQLHASLGTRLIHSSAYHPQTDGQTERVNQIFEDMLRVCVLNYPDKWDKCLPLAELFYNNSYRESLRMTPFEALYDHRCCTSVNWIKPDEMAIFGPNLVIEVEEIVHRIHANLNATRDHQESYANKWRRLLEFEAGDHVYLRASPTQDVKRFRIKGKLAPCYIGPFLILARLGNVTYRLELPPILAGVHNMFHVSQLKKCLKPHVDVVVDDVTPLDVDLSYPEHLVKIQDQ